MTTPKKYPGEVIKCRRYHNKIMHRLARYRADDGRPADICSDAFDVMIDYLADHIRSDYQNVIGIFGTTGAGKSNLGIRVCTALAARLKIPFDLEKDYIYTVDDMVAKLDDPHAHPISFIDEGSLILNAKRSMTKDAIDLVDLFNTMRSLHWTTVICAPSVFMINSDIRTVHLVARLECSSEDRPVRTFGHRTIHRGVFEWYIPKIKKHAKGEPYHQLQMAGVFKPIPESIDRVYQPLKRQAQARLTERFIANRMGAEA